jgi:hypothetical protein
MISGGQDAEPAARSLWVNCLLPFELVSSISMADGFWLYEWIDNCGIRDFDHAQRLLSDKVALADLRERAEAIKYTTEPLLASEQPTVLAGCGLDLSGHLSCFHWDCAKEQLDKLFNRVWHYFDRIVVVGPSAYDISNEWKYRSEMPSRLPVYVRLLLYIREIGAEELLVFRQKPPACTAHLPEHLIETGLQGAMSDAEKIIPKLVAEAEIKIDRHGDHCHYAFSHPTFVHNAWGELETPAGIKVGSEEVARAVVARHLAALNSDLRAAEILRCSLGASEPFQAQAIRGIRAEVPSADVALQLQLPVVNGIDLKTLLKLRNDERDSFNRFRRALEKAIELRLTCADATEHTTLAAEIQGDVVEPALSEISLRLKSASRVLARKAIESVTIGTLATLCGIYANPVLAGGVIPAINGLINARHKYLDEKREISLSEMYFLWSATHR